MENEAIQIITTITTTITVTVVEMQTITATVTADVHGGWELFAIIVGITLTGTALFLTAMSILGAVYGLFEYNKIKEGLKKQIKEGIQEFHRPKVQKAEAEALKTPGNWDPSKKPSKEKEQ